MNHLGYLIRYKDFFKRHAEGFWLCPTNYLNAVATSSNSLGYVKLTNTEDHIFLYFNSPSVSAELHCVSSDSIMYYTNTQQKKKELKKIPGPQWSAQSSQSSIVAVATHIRRSFKSQQHQNHLKIFALNRKTMQQEAQSDTNKLKPRKKATN